MSSLKFKKMKKLMLSFVTMALNFAYFLLPLNTVNADTGQFYHEPFSNETTILLNQNNNGK
jgi:hypothetical protein